VADADAGVAIRAVFCEEFTLGTGREDVEVLPSLICSLCFVLVGREGRLGALTDVDIPSGRVRVDVFDEDEVDEAPEALRCGGPKRLTKTESS
jgi:hypothetical protein